METSRMYIVDRGGGSYYKTSGGAAQKDCQSVTFLSCF